MPAMYLVNPTKAYKKSRKKILRSGRFDVWLLDEVINTLATGKVLQLKYQDHPLTGELAGYRECHIKPDVLLVYIKNEDELVLVLIDIGSHSELFG